MFNPVIWSKYQVPLIWAKIDKTKVPMWEVLDAEKYEEIELLRDTNGSIHSWRRNLNEDRELGL